MDNMHRFLGTAGRGAGFLLALTAASAQAQTAPARVPTPPPAGTVDADATAATTPAAPAGDAADGAASRASLDDIVVTGSRVKRDGYSSPTLETVLSAQNIAAAAPNNIAGYVNDLPAVPGSATPRQATINTSSGSAGSNFLNLRGLGASRTLVLLGNRRVVGASADGMVDANTLPTALISRIDIVTGNAAARLRS